MTVEEASCEVIEGLAADDAIITDVIYPEVLSVDIEPAHNDPISAARLARIEAATDGLYHRVLEVSPDGLPMWKKEDDPEKDDDMDTWFFSGIFGSHRGFWCVGNQDFKDNQFIHKREGSAFVSSRFPHAGKLPQKMSDWYSCGLLSVVFVTEFGAEAFDSGDIVKVLDEGFDESVEGYKRRGSLGKIGKVADVNNKEQRPYKVDFSAKEQLCFIAPWLQKVHDVYDKFGTIRWDEHAVCRWDPAEDCFTWWDCDTQRWQKTPEATKDVFDTFPLATKEEILNETGSPGLLITTITCFPGGQQTSKNVPAAKQ